MHIVNCWHINSFLKVANLVYVQHEAICTVHLNHVMLPKAVWLHYNDLASAFQKLFA